jgi:RNA polymerase sigma factor (sigma-70 family)
MKSNLTVDSETLCDASLIELSRMGDREAFGQIVARYQSPICALAYSACGNVARSEDLAQEIFITAWRKLDGLRKPDSFKAWLYGIARNLIQNAFRQYHRNPVAGAESIEETAPSAPPCDAPDEQAISKEEETILWQVLSSMPEIYREPMVLFYRQNESVPDVANVLSISEDAVRQRLSRGRALLNERVAKVIQNGLRHSGPANTFAIAVVAGLPALAAATTAKGALVGMATTRSGEAAGFMGILKSIGFFAGLVAIPAILGSYFGHKLGQDAGGHRQRSKAAAKFWRFFIRGLVLFLFIPLLLTFGVAGFLKADSRAEFLSVMTIWLGLAYPFVPVALVYWAWQRRRKNSQPSSAADEIEMIPATEQLPGGFIKRNSRRFVLLMTIAAGALLIFCFLDTRHNVGHLSLQQVHDLISKSAPGDLRINITVSHYRSIWGESPETFRTFLVQELTGGKKTYWAPVDAAAVALLAQKGINCPVYVQGRDFEVLGMPGRFLPFLAAFVLAIGAIFIFKRRRFANAAPAL